VRWLGSRRGAAPEQVGQVAVYRVPAGLVLSTYDRTMAGFWVAAGSTRTAAVDADAAELGEAVLAGLAGSRTDAPVPAGRAPVGEPAATAAGYRSYRGFARAAVLVLVERHGRLVTVTPTVNQGLTGPHRGFAPSTDEEVIVAPEPAEVGAAVQAALDLAVPYG
jgi:hypothetical protein